MPDSGSANQDSKLAKVSEDVLKYLTADIKDVYFDGQQPEHVAKDKKDIVRLFDNYIKGDDFRRKMESYGLEVIVITPFGSSATPLASHSGDLDLCIWLKPIKSGKSSKQDPNLVLRELLSALRTTRLGAKHMKGWKTPFQIQGAKVPIVKAHIFGYDVDISVHIGECQHPNTCAARLVQAYHLFNPKFVPLCFYIKEWFKYIVENDPNSVAAAESVIPNSYTVSLLVAQFMQKKNLLPKLLNIFKNNFFLPSSDRTFPDLRGENAITDDVIKSFQNEFKKELTEELGVSFYRFLDYLTNEVDLKNSILLVESAEFVPADSMKRHELMIVDVFDKYNPGRRVKTIDGFVDFLKDAMRRLENAHNPSRITDRLYDMQIDFKLIERTHRFKIKKATSAFEVQELKDQLKDIVGEEKVDHAKRNRPGNAERRRKQQQQQSAAVAIPPEVTPDGEPIMPALAAQPTKRVIGGRFQGNRPGSSGKNAQKPSSSTKRV